MAEYILKLNKKFINTNEETFQKADQSEEKIENKKLNQRISSGVPSFNNRSNKKRMWKEEIISSEP